jgi:hypothetical protein
MRMGTHRLLELCTQEEARGGFNDECCHA